MVTSNDTHFIVEVGPHAALRRPVQETLAPLLGKDRWRYMPTLKQGHSGPFTILEMAGTLWCTGAGIDIGAVNGLGNSQRRLADLPQYPFNRSNRCWLESRISRKFRFRSHRRHPLLGLRSKDWNASEASWRHIIKVHENPWVLDHALNGSPIYPGSGMLVMAIEAARQLCPRPDGITGYRLQNVRLLRAIPVSGSDQGSEAQLHMRPRGDPAQHPWYDWRIFTLGGGGGSDADWVEAAHGSVKVEHRAESSDDDGMAARAARRADALRSRHDEVVGSCFLGVRRELFYDAVARLGFQYGPFFRQLRDVRYDGAGRAAASIPLRSWVPGTPYAETDPCVIHPVALDALTHLMMVALSAGGGRPIPTMMFTHLKEMWVSQELLTAAGEPVLHASAYETMRGFREAEYSMTAFLAGSREPVLTSEGQRGTAITSLAGSAAMDDGTDKMCYGMDWKPCMALMTREQAQKYFERQFAVHIAPPSKETIDFADALAMHYLESVLEELDKDSSRKYEKHFEKYVWWMRQVVHDKDRVGEHLRQVLIGKADPLQVIFEGHLVDEFYHSPLLTLNSKKMGVVIEVLAHENPGLRVLEIGAGTGSSTAEILPYLTYNTGGNDKVLSEYAYTDISPAFFGRARELFHTHASQMRFEKLDIEHDPSQQGFELGAYDVVIAGNVLHATSDLQQALRHVRALLKPGGKLLLAETCNLDNQWGEALPMCGFSGVELLFRDREQPPHHRITVMVATAVDDETNVAKSAGPLVIVVDEKSGLQREVAQQLKHYLVDSQIMSLNVTRTREMTGTTVISLLELDNAVLEKVNEAEFDQIKHLSLGSKRKDLEPHTLGQDPDRHITLTIESPGLLDTLYFAEDPNSDATLDDDEVEIQVRATSLNFKDVMIALGQVPGDGFGFDGAGVVTQVGSSNTSDLRPGDRVVFFAPSGGFGTYLRCAASQVHAMPPSMDFAAAAALPVVFSTALYALDYVARLRAGETVLIHAGAGGVGQAAIQLARLRRAAKIFVTVGSAEKKQLVAQQYGIPEDCCFASRDASFAQDVKDATGGRGVDVVLNSLAGDLLLQTWDCVAPFGRFVEIGKRDIISNGTLPLGPFARNISFAAVDLTVVMQEDRSLMAEIMRNVMSLLCVTAWAPPCDVTNLSVLESTIQECSQKLPPIRGCIQGTMVLHDDLFENMTSATFHAALSPKALGSHNLHTALSPHPLTHFILLSSFGGLIGNRGQLNYAAGNTYADALARHRAARALPAVALNLPLVLEAGSANDNAAFADALRRAGYSGLRQHALMALLDLACDPAAPPLPQIAAIADSPRALRQKRGDAVGVAWLDKPLFRNMLRLGEAAEEAARVAGGGVDVAGHVWEK
ncbi:putative polyketide synthase protein [Neofusicoccum parvum UCRNP2]|uniref:Putative polyketide synthase protein n=1 Tax=Botryosphaeria parva (strain UCR-NP2) TaxID=1287680 RepID=R1EW16_BOTPV|nr:putative polyketide synthase protein [Neofusicoccum parvum UCRNP2]